LCVDEREKLVLYLLVGLLVGGIAVLFVVNVYMMTILVRHRRQLRGLGVRPVSTRLRPPPRRRPAPPPASPAEAASLVVGNGPPPPPSSPELSRRAADRPRPPRRPPSPFEVAAADEPSTPAAPPGRVLIPPRDSPVFVHVESPRESPLLGRVPPAPVDVASPPSVRDQSPVWVRFQEGPVAPDSGVPGGSSSVWVQAAPLDDSPSTTVSTGAPGLAPPRSSSSVSPASTLGGRPRAAAVVYPAGPPRWPSEGEADTLTRSYSNPYRQDSYRTADRPSGTHHRPRQRRLLRFD